MPAQSELGPLWEMPPKQTGFRLSIPNPTELFNWVKSTASLAGDKTREEMKGQWVDQNLKFIKGESNNFGPHERNWELAFNDGLIGTLRVELNAGYSPKSGEWGDLMAHINFDELAKKNQFHNRLAGQSESIALELKKKGLEAKAVVDEDKLVQSIVCGPVEVFVGLKTPEDANVWNPGSEDSNGWVSTVQINEFPLQLVKALASFQQYQYVLSHYIDALYQVAGYRVQDAVLELSESTELS